MLTRSSGAQLSVLAALTLTCLSSHALGAGVDLTLQINAGGCQVVEAVLTKLLTSEAFTTDQGLLRRVAYAETEANGGPGGPWAVKDHMLATTQNTSVQTSSVKQLIAKVENSSVLRRADGAQIVWSAVAIADLSKPLYSAITARLYIEQTKTKSKTGKIPAELTEQAEFWTNNYKMGGSESTFLNRTRKLDDKCGKYDKHQHVLLYNTNERTFLEKLPQAHCREEFLE